jgi:hypothetical protein
MSTIALLPCRTLLLARTRGHERPDRSRQRQVAEKYAFRCAIVRMSGPNGLRAIKSFHDEELSGKLARVASVDRGEAKLVRVDDVPNGDDASAIGLDGHDRVYLASSAPDQPRPSVDLPNLERLVGRDADFCAQPDQEPRNGLTSMDGAARRPANLPPTVSPERRVRGKELREGGPERLTRPQCASGATPPAQRLLRPAADPSIR